MSRIARLGMVVLLLAGCDTVAFAHLDLGPPTPNDSASELRMAEAVAESVAAGFGLSAVSSPGAPILREWADGQLSLSLTREETGQLRATVHEVPYRYFSQRGLALFHQLERSLREQFGSRVLVVAAPTSR